MILWLSCHLYHKEHVDFFTLSLLTLLSVNAFLASCSFLNFFFSFWLSWHDFSVIPHSIANNCSNTTPTWSWSIYRVPLPENSQLHYVEIICLIMQTTTHCLHTTWRMFLVSTNVDVYTHQKVPYWTSFYAKKEWTSCMSVEFWVLSLLN